MKTVKFIVEVQIPEEDLLKAEADAWRYFWNEVPDIMWTSKVEILND
jgi:hypothetical protein